MVEAEIQKSRKAVPSTAIMILTSLTVKSEGSRFGYHELRATTMAAVAAIPKDDQDTCSAGNNSQGRFQKLSKLVKSKYCSSHLMVLKFKFDSAISTFERLLLMDCR